MTDGEVVRWYPPGPVARAFLNDDSFIVGIRGPFGSGKTVTCVMKLLLIARKQVRQKDGRRHSRFAIIRNTQPELKMTTRKTWHEWVPRDLGKATEHGPPTHHIRNDDIDMEVFFVALDRPEDVRKVLSMDLTAALVNEAREVPKAIIDGLTSRVGRYPRRDDASGIRCIDPQILMDTNSMDSDHWWYVLAERDTSTAKGRELIDSMDQAQRELVAKGLLRVGQAIMRFHSQPGAYTNIDGRWVENPHAENLANLEPGYYIRMMAGKSHDWVKVYIANEYGFSIDGKAVYPEYVDSLHCQEFALIPGLPLHVGLDFGLTPAALIGQQMAMGQWRWHFELCATDMGATRFGEVLGQTLRGPVYAKFKVAKITGDPAGEERGHDADESTVFQILKKGGIPAEPASTNDFTIRRDAVGTSLSRLIDGKPGLILHPNCRVTRKGMAGSYCYRRLAIAGEDRYRDVPDKTMYSHPCEAGQYMLLGGGEGRALIRSENSNFFRKIEHQRLPRSSIR